MGSVWSDRTRFPEFESLKTDIKTDVLIVGGGITGLLCAYMLDKKGVDCVLVESSRICSGITKNTTAKITSQHGSVFDRLIREFGEEKAKLYFEANEAAIAEYKNICKNTDCNFEEKDAYLYSVDNKEKLLRELSALEKIGYKAEFKENLPLPFETVGGIRFKNQAQFHPLKFASFICTGLNIYENTHISEFKNAHTAVSDNASITADKIIIATHFPMDNKHGSYFLKMYQERSYVIALEGAPNVDGMYIDEAKDGMSFRNYKNLLFVGGGGHRTGKKGGGWRELENFKAEYYPKAKTEYRWATQDCMTLDGVPYIGKYSKNTPDFYVASGFNKWGMTSAMVSAMLLSDLVMGKENRFEAVFSPSRTILRPQLAANAFEAIINLMTISEKRCPHMGCALKWNAQERSWDCPCHGSRFEEDGELIDNPATGNIKKKV